MSARAPRRALPASRLARPMKSWSAFQRLAATVGSSVVVLLFAGLAYEGLHRQAGSREQVTHSYRTIELLERLRARLLDAEAAQRGFLLTGRERYLAPYVAADTQVAARLAELRVLARGSPLQEQRLDALAALVDAKFAELDTTIALRRGGGLDAALSVVESDRGKRLMDAIRRITATIEESESQLLAERAAREERAATVVRGILVGGTLVAILVALLINALLTRYATAQARAAQALEARADELRAAAEGLAARTREAERAQGEAEEARRAADAANAAKSQFLTAMSHELRTPLNAIGGYVDLLQMGIRGPVTDAQAEDLRRIRRSAQHLLSLINDILNLSRIEAGRLDLRVTDVPVAALVEEVETLVAPQLRVHGLSYAVAACDPALTVRADAEKLRQVVLNLLTNAVKFTPAGGHITVICEPLEAAAGDGAGLVAVRVRDTGRGIAAGKLASIFEPFVQIDRQLTERSQQGVGLGLSISRELARGMGGELTVESEVGVGSTFTLVLPRGAGGVAPAGEASAVSGERRPAPAVD